MTAQTHSACIDMLLSKSLLLAKTCEQQPAFLAKLTQPANLQIFNRHHVATELQALDEIYEQSAYMREIRRLRNRWQSWIVARDICGIASVPDTLQDISWLAEQLIEVVYQYAYRRCCERYGTPVGEDGLPTHLAIIGMGKLGGGELNFSSDIDLIAIFAISGETSGRKPLAHEDFFRRVIQQMTKILSDITADGFVYRVDWRLRPFGEVGPLACTVDAFEDYYQTHGRDWERYALVKARGVAGDITLAQIALNRVQPFVYRRYLDYSAFAILREMKQLITQQVETVALRHNIKLGDGGIREIEFIVQAYQLIYGGREAALRTPSIYKTFAALLDLQLGEAATLEALRVAYDFLRKVENQLQNWADQQTQTLPSDPECQSRLADVMQFPSYALFLEQLVQHRAAVSEAFAALFAETETSAQTDADFAAGFVPQMILSEGFATLWDAPIEVDARVRQWLSDIGVGSPEVVGEAMVRLLSARQFRAISRAGQMRVIEILPELVRGINAQYLSDMAFGVVFSRLLNILQQLCQRANYMSLLRSSPLVCRQLVDIAYRSEWLCEYLIQHPAVLDELSSGLSAALPSRDELAAKLTDRIRSAGEDLEQQLNATRAFQQAQTFRIAIAEMREQLTLMQVSDQLTWLAEVILAKELALAAAEVAAKHGSAYHDDEVLSLSVVAFGKLGGLELGYGSDLDLVFIHSSPTPEQLTEGGNRAISHRQYFAKIAQKLVSRLTTVTISGMTYDVDMRLRPSGQSGVLVTSLGVFEEYQMTSAWTWEHQALCRARMVVGSVEQQQAFAKTRVAILAQPRDPETLRQDVQAMREKMRQSLAPDDEAVFDAKHSRGGIVDIEFLVQYWLLRHAAEYPEILTYSDNIRQLEALAKAELIPVQTAQRLTESYLQLRSAKHAQKLAAADALDAVTAEKCAQVLSNVCQIWQHTLG